MGVVEVSVPQTPFAVVPGEATRVPVTLHNRSAEAVPVRVSVAPSRAGAWAPADTRATELAPGARAEVEVVFRPPAGIPVSASMLPFTVQAEDQRYGTVVGRATGLVTLSAPERLRATLTKQSTGRGTVHFALGLANPGENLLTVRLAPRLDPSGGEIEVEPGIVALLGGQGATVRVRARPKARLVGAARSYSVSVACHDVVAEDAPALATAAATGKVPARIGRAAATVLAVSLLVIVMSAAVIVGGLLDIDLPGRGTAGPPATSPPGATTQVRRPYALIDVFPRHDGPGGRADAEATLARLTAAGMAVRLIDSTTSTEVADGDAGLWVLLQDGMASTDEVRAYCDRYRAVAPKCDVVP
jgi:hypothetical protein